MEIIKLNINDINEMYELFNEYVTEGKHLKYLSFEDYKDKLLSNPDFDFDLVFGIKDNEKLIAYCIGINRKKFKDNENIPGYVNMIIVKSDYQGKGLGSKLLNHLEQEFKNLNKKYIQASYFLPSCYSWYIPNTDKHDHPCAPGIRINSKEYFFLIHRGYGIVGQEDAFHLDLCNYELSPSIKKILEDNEKDGIVIELYDPNKHYGIDDFYKDLNIYDFEKVIRSNLELEKPYPFLVVAKNNKIVGWTGAMWNEESGRGHFDGIAILDSVRGRGLGKALFSLLALYNKKGGAKFMTLYTGLNNHARYIYMGAGFKIIQSFALMKKPLK
jgi:ribosomal protein S18 acetylase RimI-like enzyme